MAEETGTFDFSNGISGVLPSRSTHNNGSALPRKTALPPCDYKSNRAGGLEIKNPEQQLLQTLKPVIHDAFSLAPMNYQVLLSESQSLFASLEQQTGDPAFADAANLLGDELFLLSLVGQQRG